jgi:hypothetical protein
MKYLTKTESNDETIFTKPSGFTSARSPRYIIYTSFAHDFPVQCFFHQKIPAAIATGILIVQILY